MDSATVFNWELASHMVAPQLTDLGMTAAGSKRCSVFFRTYRHSGHLQLSLGPPQDRPSFDQRKDRPPSDQAG
jgi:hypothetical protein